MSNITLLHDIRNVSIKDGKKLVNEEYIIKGDKGLKIKYYHKEDDDIEKIVITGSDDKYKMKYYKNKEDVVETEFNSEKELMAEIKKNKKLKFAVEQMKGGAVQLEGGAKKKASKKASKKVSKKGSKKASKKTSSRK